MDYQFGETMKLKRILAMLLLSAFIGCGGGDGGESGDGTEADGATAENACENIDELQCNEGVLEVCATDGWTSLKDCGETDEECCLSPTAASSGECIPKEAECGDDAIDEVIAAAAATAEPEPDSNEPVVGDGCLYDAEMKGKVVGKHIKNFGMKQLIDGDWQPYWLHQTCGGSAKAIWVILATGW